MFGILRRLARVGLEQRQLGPAQWGRVSALGEREGGSDGWSVSRFDIGSYAISLDRPLASAVACLPCAAGASGFHRVTVHDADERTIQIRTLDPSGDPVDGGFHFLIPSSAG